MRKISIVTIVMVFTLSEGCNRLSLRHTINHGEDDIPMYGYHDAQCNNSVSAIEPPLDSIWEHDMGAGVGIYPPAAVDSMLFIGSLTGEIQIIHAGDGSLLGKKKMGSAIVGTPVVDKDILYLAMTNTAKSVVAYDIRNGGEIWSLRIGDIESSPLLLNSKLYVATLGGDLYCIDAESGNVVWKFSIPSTANKELIRSSPVSDGNYIIICSDGGSIFSLKLNGNVAWRINIGGGVVASPVVCGRNAFICSIDGCIYSFDIRTGISLWETKLSSSVFSSPSVNEKNVVIGCIDGTVWCLERESGEKQWSRETGGVLAGSPVIAGSMAYIGSLERFLYGLQMKNGEIVYTRKFDGRIRTQPFVYKNFLLIFIEGRKLVELREANSQ